MVFGAILTSPLLTLANVKPDSSEKLYIIPHHKNFAQGIDKQELLHLQREGAISNRDFRRLIDISSKDISTQISAEISSDSQGIQDSNLEINQPNDEMLLNILTKLLVEKQFIITSNDIFEYILRRVDRTYEGINNIVNKLDILSLEKKRQLTIPLIKEIL